MDQILDSNLTYEISEKESENGKMELILNIKVDLKTLEHGEGPSINGYMLQQILE